MTKEKPMTQCTICGYPIPAGTEQAIKSDESNDDGSFDVWYAHAEPEVCLAVAVAAEREACAKIAEAMSHCHETPGIGKICGCVWCACAERLAITIRARGVEGKENG